jgi:large subunit ribosomal protein L5
VHFIEHFYFKTLKYDLINKYIYASADKLPKLKKIILNFGFKTADVKQLSAGLLAFELIANQKGTITTTTKSNILLKIRKGNPTGCKLTLQKYNLFDFMKKLVMEVFPKLKNFNGITPTRKIKKNAFSYEIHDTFSFFDLEGHYYYFNNLPKLDITIIITTKNKKEFLFILKSLQFPFKSLCCSKYNSIGRV